MLVAGNRGRRLEGKYLTSGIQFSTFPPMANRLIHSTSPYLLQHAHNPVDWFEWGTEAHAKALAEDKPILVSIGYSSCHWCHVMERESFEHTEIAALMNEHFVCIKVDREERPDVDQIYMEAVQAMGMNGGWPLNVFLTPDQKPFYGGTYFQPRQWASVLINLNKTWQEKKSEIQQSADDLKNHLNISDLKRFAGTEETLTLKQADAMFNVLRAKFDTVYGGLDKAPKFVMPTLWEFLLRYYYLTKNDEAMRMVDHTLTAAACGGIFDQLGGGFARYSVDAQWFAPHFEKMLYDNGQLLSLYAEIYTITKKPLYRETLGTTIAWLEREMMHPEGGFYSALDADTEGAEGRFYVWTFEEFAKLAGNDLDLAAAWFQVSPSGNWEHGQNILTKPDSAAEFAAAGQVTEETVINTVYSVSKRLFEKRKERPAPGLDDKILLGWNAMTICGLVDASLAQQEEKPLAMARQAMQFLETYLMADGKAYRSFKGKHSPTEAFLEDYAFLIKAYLKLYQATFDEVHLQKAKTWCDYVFKNFFDATDGFFHFSSSQAEKLIARKKEIFDNVIPSGNSVMARNLLLLADYFEKSELQAVATNMITSLAALISNEPAYTSSWGMALLESVHGFEEIALTGKDCLPLRQSFGDHYIPFAAFAGSATPSNLLLLENRMPSGTDTLIYVCRNKTCSLPVKTVASALQKIEAQ
jgi:uncharacterized protein YyaL (SSP411 family)